MLSRNKWAVDHPYNPRAPALTQINRQRFNDVGLWDLFFFFVLACSLKDQTVLKHRTILGEQWYIHLAASQQLYIVFSAFNYEGAKRIWINLKTNGGFLLSSLCRQMMLMLKLCNPLREAVETLFQHIASADTLRTSTRHSGLFTHLSHRVSRATCKVCIAKS